jgi:opacity protein-like surface antigen
VLLGLLFPGASAAEVPIPHLYVTPTAGIWRWDTNVAFGFDVPDRTRPVIGIRAGYSPVEAFAGELALLTGTNDLVRSGTDEEVGVRLTQLELSLVVNFQSLVSPRLYPFLNLGVGGSFRQAQEDPVDGDLDDSNFAFHLGGGLKWELASRWALRGNIRDTFFTESQGAGNQETQVTVDSVELSLGLEMRFPLGRSGRRDLQ